MARVEPECMAWVVGVLRQVQTLKLQYRDVKYSGGGHTRYSVTRQE